MGGTRSPQRAFCRGKRHGRLQSAPVSRHRFGFEARRLPPEGAALQRRSGCRPSRPSAPQPRPVPGLRTASPSPSTAASPTGNRMTGPRRDDPGPAAPRSATCGCPDPNPAGDAPSPGLPSTTLPRSRPAREAHSLTPVPPPQHTGAAQAAHLARLGGVPGTRPARRAALLCSSLRCSAPGSGGACGAAGHSLAAPELKVPPHSPAAAFNPPPTLL